jgi:hypothetical protein
MVPFTSTGAPGLLGVRSKSKVTVTGEVPPPFRITSPLPPKPGAAVQLTDVAGRGRYLDQQRKIGECTAGVGVASRHEGAIAEGDDVALALTLSADRHAAMSHSLTQS